jgi:hypothetical protein
VHVCGRHRLRHLERVHLAFAFHVDRKRAHGRRRAIDQQDDDAGAHILEGALGVIELRQQLIELVLVATFQLDLDLRDAKVEVIAKDLPEVIVLADGLADLRHEHVLGERHGGF